MSAGNGWYYYENVRGLGAKLSFNGNKIAIGNAVFAENRMEQYSKAYWHEETHVLQSRRHGLLWLPLYFGAYIYPGYDKSGFERTPVSAAGVAPRT